jgi:hypothetical protein
MVKIIDKISPNEALRILRQLAEDDEGIKKKIMELADVIIRDFDIDEICDDVLFALGGLDVDELWARSGATRYGYVSPEDMAVEMMEEELEPFNDEVDRLYELGMQKEAKIYCMGVLKGIYAYEQESGSEFKDHATDVPVECFRDSLERWKKLSNNRKDIEEMNSFIRKECGKWA